MIILTNLEYSCFGCLAQSQEVDKREDHVQTFPSEEDHHDQMANDQFDNPVQHIHTIHYLNSKEKKKKKFTKNFFISTFLP